jgi:hypothetical protein
MSLTKSGRTLTENRTFGPGSKTDIDFRQLTRGGLSRANIETPP